MMLKENPKIRVEIGGHTDSTGPDKVNLKISEKRAENAKKFIDLLALAGVIHRVHHTHAAGLPLGANAEDAVFKPLFLAWA
jgi:flagellar motor protein MotB